MPEASRLRAAAKTNQLLQEIDVHRHQIKIMGSTYSLKLPSSTDSS